MQSIVDYIENKIGYREFSAKYTFIYAAMFIGGLVSMILGIQVYETTIIDWKILLIPIVIGTVVGLVVTKSSYYKSFDYNSAYVKVGFFAMQNICSFGFILCSIFLHINEGYASSDVENIRAEIIRTGAVPGSKGKRAERKAYFIIQVSGLEKSINSDNTHYKNIEEYDSVSFDAREGLFGYKIMENVLINLMAD